MLRTPNRLRSLLRAGMTADRFLQRLFGTLLQRRNHSPDLFGRALTLASQLPDFIGHYGKTSALLARTRGFNGRIERQQVRLLGDSTDGIQNRADLLTTGR